MNKQKPLQRRKLWVLLRSLSDQEQKKLATHISCELRDSHPDAVKLFNNIQGNPTRELLWTATFPGESYKDVKFRKICFHLTSEVEKFIAIQGFLKDEDLKELMLVRELNRREGDEKLFTPAFKKIWTKVKQKPLRGAPYHRMQYELLREQFHYQIKHIPKHKRQHIGGVHHSFDLYWLHEKIILAISSLNHKLIGYQEISSFLQDELLERVEAEIQFMNEPTLEILKTLYRLIVGKDESAENLIEMVREYQEQFDEETYLNIYICLLNHYIRQSNITRDYQNRSKTLEMYVWGIEERLLFIDGFLPVIYFRNIIILGCQLQQLNLVQIYIDEYLDYLPFEEQEEAYIYGTALIHYYKGEYQKTVLKLINRFKNVTFEAEGKSYLYTSQYELDRTDDLEKDLRAYKIFLRNNKKLADRFRKNLLDFVIHFEKLLKHDNPQKLAELYQKVKEYKSISMQEWLLRHIELKLNRYPSEVLVR
ncbi:MAG: hypothetical protein KDD63_12760 [Bacteroidetes bacterium]|nr:hypothetical protein [Bacteroidota bacterium]